MYNPMNDGNAKNVTSTSSEDRHHYRLVSCIHATNPFAVMQLRVFGRGHNCVCSHWQSHYAQHTYLMRRTGILRYRVQYGCTHLTPSSSPILSASRTTKSNECHSPISIALARSGHAAVSTQCTCAPSGSHSPVTAKTTQIPKHHFFFCGKNAHRW